MVVKIHNGNGHVKGKAREYRYLVASLFTAEQTKTGRWVWRNSGRYVGPFRSLAKTERLAKEFAAEVGAEFVSGIGSLHNVEVQIPDQLLQAAARAS